MNHTVINNIKPFLRWVGGKTWIIKYLNEILKINYIENYHEPFLGGASIFLYLKSNNIINNKSYLSDKNKDLIKTYQVVQQFPFELTERLKIYKNTEEHYYFERNKYYTNEINKAAQFIFLNRTSFNGIYRVNQNGDYNVPYGYKHYQSLFDFENIENISNLLQNTYIFYCDFESTLSHIQEGDLVFLDPPYTVAHGKNGFIKYNQKLFSWEDQVRLRKFIDKLNQKGIYFILTNAEHSSINDLFKGIGKCYKFPRANLIGGKHAVRNYINELVFTNI